MESCLVVITGGKGGEAAIAAGFDDSVDITERGGRGFHGRAIPTNLEPLVSKDPKGAADTNGFENVNLFF